VVPSLQRFGDRSWTQDKLERVRNANEVTKCFHEHPPKPRRGEADHVGI
jgi:hypothetical protein